MSIEKMVINCGKMIGVGGVMLALAACSHKPSGYQYGASFQAVKSSPAARAHAAKEQLATYGVNVARVGETVRIIIPNNDLFYVPKPVVVKPVQVHDHPKLFKAYAKLKYAKAKIFYAHQNKKVLVNNTQQILATVQKYINASQVVSMQIATFASTYPVSVLQEQVALKRSQIIMHKLVNMGLDVRLTSAQGDLRTNARRTQLVFKPTEYNNMTIIYFRTNPNNWVY
jgi:hypothetical protein